MSNFVRAWVSLVKLPPWLLIWVWVLLLPANMATLLFTDTPTGYWGAWAFVFICLTNFPLLFINGGLTKVLAIPHLIAWVPLLGYILYRAFFGEGYVPGSRDALIASVLLLANGISIGFDVYDLRAWMAGHKGVVGFPDAKAVI
jgi:hypothetical protein